MNITTAVSKLRELEEHHVALNVAARRQEERSTTLRLTREALTALNPHQAELPIIERCIQTCRDQRGVPPTPYNHGVDCCIHALEGLRSRVQPAAVMPIDDWHEEYGPVVWWKWSAEDGGWTHEPSYIGTPLDSDWPGDEYFTHFTPHPEFPPVPKSNKEKQPC